LQICNKEIRIKGVFLRIGFIDGEGFQFLEDPDQAVQELRNARKSIDLFTFVQRIAEPQPRFDFCMERDNFAVLPVTTFDHWMTSQISPRLRTTIRKTAKDGVVLREVALDEELIRGISAIYNEAPVRQGRRFRHYQIDLQALRAMKSTFLDRSVFIGAYWGAELIGFIKLVMDERQSQAGIMHILSMVRHRDKAPANALIAQAVRSCATRGIPNLWYTNFHYGRKGHDSLAEFKRRNGFQKVEIPRYYVPLSATGRIALRLGLHHGMADWVPEPVTAAYRKMRSSWYAKRYPGFQNA
jgi:hypothetical protein